MDRTNKEVVKFDLAYKLQLYRYMRASVLLGKLEHFLAIACSIVLSSTIVRSEPFLLSPLPFEIKKTTNCGCRLGWAEHLKRSGFLVTIETVTAERIALYRSRRRTGQDTSCHVGLIDGYAIEGHVPARDVMRLLELQHDVVGLRAPLMPIGSLGLEDPENAASSDVLLIKNDGSTELFAPYAARHLSEQP